MGYQFVFVHPGVEMVHGAHPISEARLRRLCLFCAMMAAMRWPPSAVSRGACNSSGSSVFGPESWRPSAPLLGFGCLLTKVGHGWGPRSARLVRVGNLCLRVWALLVCVFGFVAARCICCRPSSNGLTRLMTIEATKIQMRTA